MRALMRLVQHLIRDRRAATSVEYGFILTLIVLAMMAALIQVAETTTGMWSNVSSQVQDANK